MLQRKQCDNRLLAIKVPDIISRPPRSLEDYSHWKGMRWEHAHNYAAVHVDCYLYTFKGAQLREWLLYYSVPVLHDILPSSLFNHYCYLVAGVHIILADCITEVQIDCADSCFHEFYSQFSANYGRFFWYSEGGIDTTLVWTFPIVLHLSISTC